MNKPVVLTKSSMRNLFHLFSALLLVGALALAYGPIVESGTLPTDGDVAGVSGEIGTIPQDHDHGPGESGEAHHHCKATFCTSVVMIHGGYHGLPDFGTFTEVLAPLEETHIGSAYLDNDPPVPRFSA